MVRHMCTLLSTCIRDIALIVLGIKSEVVRHMTGIDGGSSFGRKLQVTLSWLTPPSEMHIHVPYSFLGTVPSYPYRFQHMWSSSGQRTLEKLCAQFNRHFKVLSPRQRTVLSIIPVQKTSKPENQWCSKSAVVKYLYGLLQFPQTAV